MNELLATVANGHPVQGPAWSFSQLKNFETCGRRYERYNVTKEIEEPETEQMREGWRVHSAFEKRLLQGDAFPLGMGMYEKIAARILASVGSDKLVGEQKLAFDNEFGPSAWFGKKAWCRSIIDAGVIRPDRATIFDWKTGKVSPEPTQLAIMASTIFFHMPKVEVVRGALVFINHDHIETEEYTRDSLTEIWGDLLPRYRAMAEARARNLFTPKPSGLCKKYCAVKTCEYFGKGSR